VNFTKTLYVFGNEYLSQDSMARRVAAALSDVQVVHCYSPEELPQDQDEIWILDVVQNTRAPVLLTNLDSLKVHKLVSLHDFDLAFYFQLLKELGTPVQARIIGVPSTGDPSVLAREVQALLHSSSAAKTARSA
jgi:hypothetical protein